MDNVGVRPSTTTGSVSVSTDEINGVHHPRYKIEFGEDGSATEVSAISPLPVIQSHSLSAFGESSVIQPRPIVQIQFPYAINTEIVEDRSHGGSLSVDQSRAKLSTGAAANQAASFVSRVPVKYNPGQGGLARFTGVFTDGVANSSQIIGIGDVGDGYLFGYDGATFGVLRRSGGVPEVRSFQVTTGSSTAENITVTVNSVATTVAVTNSSNVTTTANEIADTTFNGWQVHSEGDTVYFISHDTTTKNGTYSITASTAAGTFSQDLAAVASTDTWTAQTAWSEDRGDNTGILPAMDWTKGNVFQIRYQWLGYGLITFFVENPEDGHWILVHKIQYANANTLPSVQNPTLPLFAMVENTTNATDIIMYTSSMAGFVEGLAADAPVRHGKTATKSIPSSTEIPIVSLHNQHIYQSKLNRTRVKLSYIGITNETGKPAIVHFTITPTLTDASFSALNANDSVIDVDTSATAITGGSDQFGIVLRSGSNQVIDLTGLNFWINPGQTFTVSAAQTASGTSSEVTVSINWEEHF